MKKQRLLVSLSTLGVAAMLLTSCDKLPQAEIDLAKGSIDSAKVAGAETYAPESFVALQDSMKSVLETIEAENSGFFKDFSASKEGLTAVSQFAGEVKLQAENRKVELKNQIQATITEVKGLIEANKQLILDAPKGKEGTTALVAIQGELSTIETSLTEAGTILETGNYFASLDKASAAKEKASAINAELQNVIAKYKANVKARRG